MPLTLTYKGNAKVPLEAEVIAPDRIAQLSLAEIEQLEVFHGKEKAHLGDFYRVTGEAASEQIFLEGDNSNVHRIGWRMGRGRLVFLEHAGRHIGSEMTGGEIQVHGNASDWLGAEMHGGMIHVRGNAGHLVGAAYRGSRVGMRGGTLLIEGSAGNEIGHTLRRGIIAIGGEAGDLAGFNMKAGTILLFGDSGIRHGAGMRRGTIGFFGAQQPTLLPTFRSAGTVELEILRILLAFLRKSDFSPAKDLERFPPNGFPLHLFHGDLIEGSRGEIWMRA